MKKINQVQFNKIGRTKAQRAEWWEKFKALSIGEGLIISKEEWPSSPKGTVTPVNFCKEVSQNTDMKFKGRTIPEEEGGGWAILRME